MPRAELASPDFIKYKGRDYCNKQTCLFFLLIEVRYWFRIFHRPTEMADLIFHHSLALSPISFSNLARVNNPHRIHS